jgi:hypothetical protein
MALVLGIIGLAGNLLSCCCCLGLIPALCAPVAWWMGARELRAIREGLASRRRARARPRGHDLRHRGHRR